MSVKKLLILTVSALCINTSAYAKWFPQVCRDRCNETACKNETRRSQCELNCQETPEVLDACKKDSQAGEAVTTPIKESVVEPKVAERVKPALPPRPALKKDSQAGVATTNPIKEPVVEQKATQPTKPTQPPRMAVGAHRNQALPSQAHSTRSTKPTDKQADVKQDTLLAMAQIEMLTEANKIAAECDRFAFEIAKKGAKDPEEYERVQIEGDAKEVFPARVKSVFDMNPQFCTETVEPEKMDHQSFVQHLKTQIQTTKTILADIVKEVLNWNDISKVKKYKMSVSGDFRLLSSVCLAPKLMLEQAIEFKKQNPTPSTTKKQTVFGKLKERVTGSK